MDETKAEYPQTDEEWQYAADASKAFQLLESLRFYGLVEGGPVINLDKCEELLELAAERLIYPTDEGVIDVIARYVKGKDDV